MGTVIPTVKQGRPRERIRCGRSLGSPCVVQSHRGLLRQASDPGLRLRLGIRGSDRIDKPAGAGVALRLEGEIMNLIAHGKGNGHVANNSLSVRRPPRYPPAGFRHSANDGVNCDPDPSCGPARSAWPLPKWSAHATKAGMEYTSHEEL